MERSDRRMLLRFVYFIYYVACRRDQMWMPRIQRPALTASYAMPFFFGWPVFALLAFLNHFTDWLTPWTRVWTGLGFPGNAADARVYAFLAVGVAITLIGYRIIFSKRRYDWIMHEFAAHDPTPGLIGASLIWLLPMVPVVMISAYSLYPAHDPVVPNLIIWAIIGATEIGFRLWWRHLRRSQHSAE